MEFDFLHFIRNTICSRLVLLILFMMLFSGCSNTGLFLQEPSGKGVRGECVILLHGLGRTYHSMDSMQDALSTAGYHTVNLGYLSTEKNIESIVKEDIPLALGQCQKYPLSAIHFVTHSLGGIVVRKAIAENRPKDLGRVVMLSPPNHGSEIVDEIGDWWIYNWLNGPAGQQLSTASNSIPNQLGQVDYSVGIITGDQSAFFDTWFATIIPGRDDGKVSTESAKVDGMRDFLVVPQSHSFIMDSENVQYETIYFLKNGEFSSSSVSFLDSGAS